MKALLKTGARLQLSNLDLPEPGLDEVLIRVHMAGLCRTDILVIQGKLPCLDPLIPGHELAGQIVSCGADVAALKAGDRVTVHPLIGCGACNWCQRKEPEHCAQAQMLGVDRHGAFAEYLCVPARNCYRLPQGLSWQVGAYTEPVAAALGSLKSGILPGQQGMVCGHNRIAELTRRLLKQRGIIPLEQDLHTLPSRQLDYVIESQLNPDLLSEILRVLKPGGLLILKSRHLENFPLPWSEFVRREIRLQGLYYGSFEEALNLLNSDTLELEDLLGQSFALDAYASFLTPQTEDRKSFLELSSCVASLPL